MNAYKTLMAALLSLGISASSFAKVSISVAVPLSLNSRSLNIAQNENTVSGPSVETCESEPILAILDADEDLRNETITRLVNILSDAQEDPTLRTRAAGVLAILGPRIQDTVPELLFVLRNDPDFEIRAAAAYALHNIKAADKDLIHELSNALLSPQLIQEIEGRRSDNTGIFFVENISSEEEEKDSILDSYYNLQAMAAYILANTDSNIEIAIPNLTKALTSPDPSVQVGVRNALRAHSGPDPSNLIKILKNETPEVRNDVLNSLVEIGPQAVPSILAALRTDNLIVQRSAIYALGEIEEPYETESERLELEAELLEILRSTPDLNTTILATFTLAKVGSNIDLEPYFLSIFENVDLNFYDPIFDAFIDYSSVNSIAKITPEYPSLTIALWSKAYNQKAKNALNIVWEENGFNLVDALISLIETLQDLDDQGRLGGEDIDSVIAQLLSYMDLDEANLALADIAQNSDIGLSIRTSAARSLGQIGPANSEAMSTKEVMSVLFEMVQNSEINPEIRLSAATTLYDLNSDFSSVDSAMVEMVQSSDMEPGIRVSAASALIDSAWSRTLESIIQSGDTSLISDSAALTIESLEILGIDGSDLIGAENFY